MELINIGPLEGFYRVASTGGYARAARATPYPITEPAVHKQVRRVEDALGVRLFERVAKDRVQLTAAGRYLYSFVAPFIRGLPAVCREVSAHTHGGSLRIDATGIVINHLLPEWVAALRQCRPDIVCDINEVQSVDLARLHNGDTDILVDYRAAEPAGVAVKRVASIRPLVVVPSRVATTKKRPSWSVLGAEPFIFYNHGRVQRNLQEAALDHIGVSPPSATAVASVSTILQFVAAGVGWSIVPWVAPKLPGMPGLRAFHTRSLLPVLPVFALWRQAPVSNPLVQALLEHAGPNR